MKKTYIAVDIGASSGRLMKSQLTVEGKLTLEEVHRFKNGYHEEAGTKYWDIDHLIQEILVGLAKLKATGVTACHVGIDTWGVDYCLLDANGQRLQQPICYRDERTDQAVDTFSKKMSLEKLYQKTGIQIQPFNTLFQLFVEDSALLQATEKVLLIPDYLGYVFTGNAVLERTNGSTTQLLNGQTGQLDQELLSLIGMKLSQFPAIVEAGTFLGELQATQFPDYDLPEATFVTVASHDTASAVVGTPGEGERWAFISSGTWSLLGAETSEAIISDASLKANYTNESGAFKTTRFLKNIMGLWLIQEVARMEDYCHSYAELAEMANQADFSVPSLDVNDPCFLSPDNMIEAIKTYCRDRALPVPETTGQLALTIYANLAACYGRELATLSSLLQQPLERLQIVGGGANASLLNQLTADATGVVVEAGPIEATAIGNIVMQLLATKELASLQEARHVVRNSFDLKEYYPATK